MIRWSQPVLLVLLIALPWLWRRGRTARVPMTRASRLRRSLVFVLLVLAASGLRVRVGDGPATVMFVVDRSDSLPAEARAKAMADVNAMAALMRPEDRKGLVAFGATAALERRPDARPEAFGIDAIIPGSATDIEAALRTARLALAPNKGRIVLVSDGRETAGDAAREAARAAAAGIGIDVLPAGGSAVGPGRTPRVTAVFAPPDAGAGEPFLVTVDAEGAPGSRRTVTLHRDGDGPLQAVAAFGPDGTARVSFTDRRTRVGTCTYRAFIQDDAGPGAPDERAGAVVTVSGEPEVLYVSSGPGSLAALLAGAGYRIRRADARAVPSAAVDLSPYAAVVLDAVEAGSLAEAQQASLAQYVEHDGGGLLLLGGPSTLTLDGYPAGVLGDVLPVDLRPRAGQRAAAVAFVLVFDKSGSMADTTDGVSKIEMARQAVMRVVETMPPSDQFGAIAFDASPVAVAEPGARLDAQRIERVLRSIEPGGSTSIAPAVEMALGWLRRARAERRHLLLISDGRTTPADAARLEAALAGQRVELSVVAIGADADRPLIERLASGTGGRAYFPGDVRQLPQIAAREAVRSTGGRTVQEPFVLRATPHPALAGLDLTALPRMGGYVVSAARPGADAMLTSHLGDPVLCAWRAGLGRVAVFTGDLPSAWAAALRAWAGFAPLWGQTVRWLARPAGATGWRVALDDTGAGPRLVVHADQPPGGFAGVAPLHATILRPEGITDRIALRPAAPGQYEAPLGVLPAGPYVVSVEAAAAAGGPGQRVLRGFYWSSARERDAAGIDLPRLGRLAAVTGGAVLDARSNPFDRAREPAARETWPLLATLALMVFLVEVATGGASGLAWIRRKLERSA